MKEIVDQILKEEDTAREIIEKARKDSQDLVQKAQKDSQKLLDKTEADIKSMASQRQKEAESKFLAEREKTLTETRNTSVAMRGSKEKSIPTISKEVFLRIINIEL